jgi:hypothetical protein
MRREIGVIRPDSETFAISARIGDVFRRALLQFPKALVPRARLDHNNLASLH